MTQPNRFQTCLLGILGIALRFVVAERNTKVQTVWIVVDAQQVSNPSNVCLIISVDCHALAVELAGEEGVNMSSANQNTRECVV